MVIIYWYSASFLEHIICQGRSMCQLFATAFTLIYSLFFYSIYVIFLYQRYSNWGAYICYELSTVIVKLVFLKSSFYNSVRIITAEIGLSFIAKSGV